MELGALKQKSHCHKASLGGALLQKGPEVKWAPASCPASFSFSKPLFYFLKESQSPHPPKNQAVCALYTGSLSRLIPGVHGASVGSLQGGSCWHWR